MLPFSSIVLVVQILYDISGTAVANTV